MAPDSPVRRHIVLVVVIAGVIAATAGGLAAWRLGGFWVDQDPGASGASAPPEAEPPEQAEVVQRPATKPPVPKPSKSTPPPDPSPEAKPSAEPTGEPSPAPRQPPESAAGTLRIPDLGVEAPVERLPVGENLTLDPPADYTTVGLWPLGAQPGDSNGTSIIAGHTVHTGGGALDDLEQASPGDPIVLERPGADLEYVVESVTTYRKATLGEDAETIFSQSSPGRLAVVTCEDWNGSVYLSNVVVIANPA